ncbi:MAG: type IV secretion system protein [Rhodospirillales bacterium]|nr:type IV secretion system protein [Rhodospirillales bacterium]
MSKLGNILENTKVMALTDKSDRIYHFLGQAEKEKHSVKMYYYLWLSRMFIFTAAISLAIFVAASLALFKLAPMVTVEPFLIINQSSSDDIARYEPIALNMASREQFIETFVRQYVMYRNTVLNDELEMMSRWYPGGIINFLSSPDVYKEFNKNLEKVVRENLSKGVSREVEIISSQRVGGKRSAVWKVNFKTYEILGHDRNDKSGYLVLNTAYWTASITAFFIPERIFMGRRLMNPLGFTVVKYDQSKVQF